MKRHLRVSTQAKSEDLNRRLKQRERKSRKRRSKELIRLADKNSASINEALQLSVINQSSEDTDTSSKDTAEDLGVRSEQEYWYDTSGNELINLEESPATPTSAPNQDPETWSSTNKFFPEGCILSPPSRPLLTRAVSVPVLAFRPTDSNINASTSDSETDHRDPPSPTGTVIMVVDTFSTDFADIKNRAVSVEMLIDRFNADTVTVLDKDDYKEELKRIFDALIIIQEKMVTIRGTLNCDVEAQKKKYDDVTTFFNDIKKRVIENETAVKKQLVKLLNESESSRSDRVAEADVKKLTLKLKNAVSKFKSLKKEVEDLPEVISMTDNEVRQSVVSSKEWKRDLKSFESLKETLDVDMITTMVDDDIKAEFENTYKETVKVITDKISQLLLADKNLGLFSLTENKSKSIVQYPDTFGGSLGENVFKFVKDFRDAIEADQIRKADEVKTLLKYLKGDAKSNIGEHHKTLDSALKQLEDNYGCPRLIVDKYTRDYEKALGSIRNWGKHGTKERVDAINKTADFIRNLENLAADHPAHLKSEIYSKQTLMLLTKGMPHDYTKKLNETCGHSDPYEDWISAIFDILEETKHTNLSALSTGIGAARSSKEDHPSNSKVNQTSHNGHDCTKSNYCRERWDYLGCINLYKVTQVSDRESFLRERRACFKCGKSPFSIKGGKRHICSWKNGKMSARCTGKHSSGGRCYKAAAMCVEHEENASDVLLDWLQSHRIKFSVNMILLSHGSQIPDSYYDTLKAKVNKQEKIAAKARPQVKSRESLQSGKSALMMSDDEIYEFFSHDMQKLESSAEVQKIPSGEPVFIFCVIQGLSNPVMAFIDSGANCWLAQEGIPEKEFISVKLSDGPIPLSVASGITAYASAEYASLLQLDNAMVTTSVLEV